MWSSNPAAHQVDLPVSRALAVLVAIGAHLVEIGEAVLLGDPLARCAVGADSHGGVLPPVGRSIAGFGDACEGISADALRSRREEKVSG